MFLRDVATWRRRFQLFPSTFSSDLGRQRRFEGLVKVLQRRLVAPEYNVVLGTRIKPALDIDRAATKELFALELGLAGASVIAHRVAIDALDHRCYACRDTTRACGPRRPDPDDASPISLRSAELRDVGK